jgi:D-alanyl-D-alanine carboxypeptidase
MERPRLELEGGGGDWRDHRRREHRRRWERRRRRRRVAYVAAGILAIGGGVYELTPEGSPTLEKAATPKVQIAAGGGELLPVEHAPPPYGRERALAPERVSIHFKHKPRAGLLFDLDSGKVLWSRNPDKKVAIASLTKIMTALVVTAAQPPTARVRITRDAVHYAGSGVGVLPRGRKVMLETLLYGLLLPSGNDAAIALAEHTAGSLPAFIAQMNDRAKALELQCTHFASVDGFQDANNESCAADLAVMTRELMAVPRLAKIVGSRQAIMPLPIKGGKVYLYNNNPLLRTRYAGTTGVKTGYTDKAGRCLVATVTHGRRRLGVVLLHSPDPATQAKALFKRGFAALRRAAAKRS